MSPRGGIAKPPWVELTSHRRCCQLAPHLFPTLFPTGGLRNSLFGPSLVGIGDKAGSPSDGLPSKLCAPLDVSRIAHGQKQADVFYPRRSVLTAFLAACFLADAALFASAQTRAAM